MYEVERQLVADYLADKAKWSVVNDYIMWWAPRKVLKNFPDPKTAANYLFSRYKYKNDPLNGLLDHLIHHDRLQAKLETGEQAVPWQAFDCDKVASWAHATTTIIPGCTSCMLTLVCAFNVHDPLSQSNWGHHTICVGEYSGKYFAIDTNGYHDLPDLEESTIDNFWTKIYWSKGYRYLFNVKVPYPFKIEGVLKS